MAEMMQTEPPLPKWIIHIWAIDWLVALILFILNWKVTIVIWIIRFILKVLPVLETCGNIFISPFIPKLPTEVSEKHLQVARAIKKLKNTSLENETRFRANYKKVEEAIQKLDCNKDDEKIIGKALNYLEVNYDEIDDVIWWCEHGKEIREREKWWKEQKEQEQIRDDKMEDS